MNFFKKKTTWMNVELMVLKIAIGSVFVLIGAYFHHFIHSVLIPVIILCIITVAWAVVLWLKKMKQEN
ncbi:hypothetical protein [Paludibacter jiangxiensis]|uniref:Uncharacterized protein n=1 Tax=Paludibacter jiangxiensis TaxID=681398 RepID=A0A161LG46_9BACT|nr:hypothetical protein [Paludibacter jiangxiensis]GAT63767.1 hypothetical protein PJIAN_4308 [Paludibacter jiangxiensis]